MEFKRLYLKNFMSYEEASIDFTPGLKILQGRIGSGKTALLSAIIFALFGKGERGHKKDLVNDQKGKGCLVQVDLSIGDDDITIRRGIKPNFFEVFINDEQLKGSSDSEVQESLERILGVNRTVFSNIIGLSVDKGLHFFKMSTAERKSFFHYLIGSEIEEEILDRVDKLRDAIIKERENLIEKFSRYKSELSMLQRIIENAGNEIIEKLRAKGVDDVEGRIPFLKMEVENSIKTKSEIIKELERGRDSLLREESSIHTSIRRIDKEIQNRKEEIKEYGNLEFSDRCKEEVLKEIIPAIEERIKDLMEQRDGLQKKMKEIMRKKDDILQRLREETELRENLVSVHHLIEQAERAFKEKEKAEREKGKLEKIIEELEKKIKTNRDIGDKLTNAATVFSRKFRAALIKELSTPLLTLANKGLETIGFPFRLIETEEVKETMMLKDLISGKERPYQMLSTGQRRLVDFSFLLALQELLELLKGLHPNILFLDEFFSSLDPENVYEALEILREKSKDRTIIVTSHNIMEPIEDSEAWIVERGPHTRGFSILTIK